MSVAILWLWLHVAGIEMPRVTDPRLELELLASEPTLMTPTGVAVDAKGNIYVIECHTHFRPADYPGPKKDRILRFDPADPKKPPTVFFEGSEATMGIGFHPDGSLYVATRMEVFRLRDKDGDGRADERAAIAHLETAGNYPHNGLSGFAFDVLGDVYFGMGENLGAQYKLVGSDGSSFSGGGEGGNIFYCGKDGADVCRFATGFWNPFHLCFDAFGRLFAVDNDPDSRPPCRLLHILDGGDYGYRYRHGRKGLHPFTAWDGELPGTLPMVAGTGEAPSGIVAYESDQLPADYLGKLIVTSWGDHRIDAFQLKEHGASFRATPTTIVQGGEDFRPVGIALGLDGSLVFTDWVKKEYHLHQHGRLWRLRARTRPTVVSRPTDPNAALVSVHGPLRSQASYRLIDAGIEQEGWIDVSTRHPSAPIRFVAALTHHLTLFSDRYPQPRPEWFADEEPAIRSIGIDSDSAWPRKLLSDPSWSVRCQAVRGLPHADRTSMAREWVKSPDPFVRMAVRGILIRPTGKDQSRSERDPPLAWNTSVFPDAQVRLEALLALRSDWADRSKKLPPKWVPADLLPRALDDSDPWIRFVALEWIFDDDLKQYLPAVEKMLTEGHLTRELFEACLVTIDKLKGKADSAMDTQGGQTYIARLIRDNPRLPPAVIARALRILRPDHSSLSIAPLKAWLNSGDETLRLEALRTLRGRREPARLAPIMSIAGDPNVAAPLRAEAIMGITADTAQGKSLLLSLAADSNPVLRDEAIRSLRSASLSQEERQKIVAPFIAGTLATSGPAPVGDERHGITPQEPERAKRSAQLTALLDPVGASKSLPAPAEVSQWEKLLAGNGDPSAGARIFFHPNGPKCFQCHTVDGRGGDIGPDLSTIGKTLDRRRLIESILEPSKEIAPRYVSWLILTKDGRSKTGVLLGDDRTGKQTFGDETGKTFSVQESEIEAKKPQTVSIMPAELYRQMTPGEFRDLLAFLLAPR